MSWYALYTDNDKRAAHGLLESGFNVFWPTRRKWMKAGRTRELVSVGLLAPYVFAVITDETFRRAMANQHVLWILGSTAPCPIPADIMQRAITSYTTGEWDDEAPTPAEVKPNRSSKPTQSFSDFSELAAFLSQQAQPIASVA